MKPTAVIAAVLLAMFVLGGLIAAPFVSDANRIDVQHWQGFPLAPCFQDAAHCSGHVLGTDEDGRDVFARLVVGMRNSLGVAVLALLIEFAIAAALDELARRAGGFADFTICRFAEGVSALPRLSLVLIFAGVSMTLRGHYKAPSVILIAMWLGVLLWPRAMLLLRERAGYTAVARRALSDLITILLLGATLDFFERGLFSRDPSWGNMLAWAQSNMEVAWWAVMFPAVCIFVTALLLNVLRRGLTGERDADATSRGELI